VSDPTSLGSVTDYLRKDGPFSNNYKGHSPAYPAAPAAPAESAGREEAVGE
jgi:hypothetical protein